MINKILVVGKKNHLGWVEHVYNGFKQNNNQVELFYTNKFFLKKG